MLTIKDKSGKTKFVWTDESSEPMKIDDLIISDQKEKDGKQSKESKQPGK